LHEACESYIAKKRELLREFSLNFKKKEKMKIIARQNSIKKGDKFESKDSRYKYVIKDIDYSSIPNMVQMMYIDNKDINNRETFTIKLPLLLLYIKDRIIYRMP
jgi:Zn-dependent M16 (insulinase) family peptidase